MATTTPTSPAADPAVHQQVQQAVADYWRQPTGPDDHCHECRHGTVEEHVAARLPDLHQQMSRPDWLFVVSSAEDTFLASW